MRHRVPRHSVGGPKVRVPVRIPQELRASVDRSAERHHLSRSAELSRLLRIALGKPFPTHPKCARSASI
jgi:metal-responsive CopG/Arc/MetJ family transcriptional regulator